MRLVTLNNFAATEETGVAALGLDPWAILAQAATFLLLFWVVKKFAMTKIIHALEERRRTIDDGVRLGREMEAQQKQLDRRAAEIMQNAHKESDKIIAEGQKEASALLKESKQRASAQAEALVTEAHVRIEEDIEKSRQKLEKELRVLVADATEVVLQDKIDRSCDESLIKRAIKAVKHA